MYNMLNFYEIILIDKLATITKAMCVLTSTILIAYCFIKIARQKAQVKSLKVLEDSTGNHAHCFRDAKLFCYKNTAISILH